MASRDFVAGIAAALKMLTGDASGFQDRRKSPASRTRAYKSGGGYGSGRSRGYGNGYGYRGGSGRSGSSRRSGGFSRRWY